MEENNRIRLDMKIREEESRPVRSATRGNNDLA